MQKTTNYAMLRYNNSISKVENRGANAEQCHLVKCLVRDGFTRADNIRPYEIYRTMHEKQGHGSRALRGRMISALTVYNARTVHPCHSEPVRTLAWESQSIALYTEIATPVTRSPVRNDTNLMALPRIFPVFCVLY